MKPPPTPQPRQKMKIGDPVVAIGRGTGFRVDGTFDGVFQVENPDRPGGFQTLFWVKDDNGDRWRFLPREVHTRMP